MKRRHFLAALPAATAAPLLAKEETPPASTKRACPIGVSTYSYIGLWKEEDHLLKCVDRAAEMGFDGVELLRKQMPSHTPAYLNKVKRRAFTHGLPIMGYSTHQDFLEPSFAKRKENIDITTTLLEEAYHLGIPIIRINTGRWGTSKDFNELMANRGIEPALDGHSEDEAFKWVIDSIEQLIPQAEKRGVVLGLENHWGLSRTADGLLRILDAIDSPWLQGIFDSGNFLDDMYPQLEKIAPRTAFVQAKTYFGGGRWYTLDIDYARIAAILGKVNYSGWISLEFEGKKHPDEGVPESLALLRKHF